MGSVCFSQFDMSARGPVMLTTARYAVKLRCYDNSGEKIYVCSRVSSINNFCGVCNVNLLHNIWIWKV